MDKDIFVILNRARVKPSLVIPYLEKMKAQYTGKYWNRPGEIPIITNEGVAVIDETIKFLQN